MSGVQVLPAISPAQITLSCDSPHPAGSCRILARPLSRTQLLEPVLGSAQAITAAGHLNFYTRAHEPRVPLPFLFQAGRMLYYYYIRARERDSTRSLGGSLPDKLARAVLYGPFPPSR